MNIHEYQAKDILRRYGVAVQEGIVAATAEEAEAAARSLKTNKLVVKAQIHAGGRGKAGGVKLVKSPEEAATVARNLLGKVLVTHQTGPQGKLVQKVYVAVAPEIKRELYLSVLIDRAIARPSFLASTEGGVDIEAVAAKTPEKIFREPIDPAVGMQPFQARKIAYHLGLGTDAIPFLPNVYRAFIETDASLIEINPLIVTGDGKVSEASVSMNAR